MGFSEKEVVITGVGTVSPIGIGRGAFEASLATGQLGIRVAQPGQLGSLSVGCVGIVEGFDAKAYVKPRKSIKLMCRQIQLGYAAAMLAVEDAKLDTAATPSERFGVVMGSEMLYGPPHELELVIENSTAEGSFQIRRFGERILCDMFPLWMLNYLPNMAACHIGIGNDAQGANNSIVQGDASSLLAIAEAASVIQRGWCDVMIAGGCGSRINVTYRTHIGGLAGTKSKSPEEASRPFDVARDGAVFGEGAGALLLESAEHAQQRGAIPMARLLGWAATHTGKPSKYCGPDANAIQRSIELALVRSGRTADDLDHVNAHGLSEMESDREEARAIAATVGDVPVTALKSYFGNLGAGSGAVEAAASATAWQRGRVPGTLNHRQTDPQCPITVIPSGGKPCEKPCALLLNQSNTGQSVAIVIEEISTG